MTDDKYRIIGHRYGADSPSKPERLQQSQDCVAGGDDGDDKRQRHLGKVDRESITNDQPRPGKQIHP
jgi:hypothetical protein